MDLKLYKVITTPNRFKRGWLVAPVTRREESSDSVEEMNSSPTSQSQDTSSQCKIFIFLGGTLDHTTTMAYVVLVLMTVVSIMICPITTVLNALVIIAVKTKPRLQTMSNIALACLATTDGIMGVIGQPLFIAGVVGAIKENCLLTASSKYVIRLLITASLLLLALINVERYIAIKHSLQYITIVTKTRLICSSAVLWFISLLLTVPFAIINNTIYLKVSNISFLFCIVVIIFCQVVLWRETRYLYLMWLFSVFHQHQN